MIASSSSVMGARAPGKMLHAAAKPDGLAKVREIGSRRNGASLKIGLVVGLCVTALGWGLLLCYPLMLLGAAASADPAMARDFALHAVRIGENLIMTGLAITVLIALDRQARPDRPTMESRAPLAPIAVPPPHLREVGSRSGLQKQPAALHNRDTVVSEGQLAGRDYQVMKDGTVSMDTLLGRRRFRTLQDARAFVGA